MIHIVSDAERVATAGVRLIDTMLRGRARQTDGLISLVLSGGTTPRRLYELLAGKAGDAIPWEKVALFWGDERCLPPDDPNSNYGMVERTRLLERPMAAIYRMPGELEPDDGAREYERDIREALAGDRLPRFDLVLLGVGEDGHTASIFPDAPGLVERSRLVLPTDSYQGARRLTLTLPVLAAARSLLFLVSGEAKAQAVRDALSAGEKEDKRRSPVRTLLDMVGIAELADWDRPSTTWVIDRSAAVHLRSTHS